MAALSEQWRAAVGGCRGGTPGTPEQEAACDEWSRIGPEIEALGWCFGKESDVATAHHEWHECGPDSLSP